MDITYLLFLQSIREAIGGVCGEVILLLTTLGESAITYLLLGFIYWCIDKRAGQLMALNVSFACTYNQVLKNTFKVERPWNRDARVVPVPEALSGAGGYSFPSGHTTRVTATWGALGAALWKQKAKLCASGCWLVVAGVAFSRNFLGVHTPQDVLVSLLIGLVLIIVLMKILEWVEGDKNRDIWFCGIGCLICFIPMLRFGCLTNAGAGMGFLVGWLLERRIVRFEVCLGWKKRILRFLFGAVSILFILRVFHPVLGQIMVGKYAGFFATFLLAIFIMFIYPLLFQMWKRSTTSNQRKRTIGIIIIVVIAGLLCTKLISMYGTYKTNLEMQENQIKSTAVIAHRGYSDVYPENTLAAFAGAMDIGADYIELDVQMTSDGQIVVFHDADLKRITGEEGAIADYTLEQLKQLDVGNWFGPEYAGERIPTLQEALQFMQASDCQVYLELKDIGSRDGFVETVMETVEQCGMLERCVLASFQYDYLQQVKSMNAEAATLFITTMGKATLPAEFPADFYGLHMETVTADVIQAIHDAGCKVFVWTVETPEQMRNLVKMGADGLVTNKPGLTKVMLYPEYTYLTEQYQESFALPGLYEKGLSWACEDMVVQGLTKAGNRILISAYSKSGENNSILYVLDLQGNLLNIVDLHFQAHTGGIAYDEQNALLWTTGPEGHVYGIGWENVISGDYQGDILVDFDAELLNQDQSKVASFLTYDSGELYVGSYVNGTKGRLKRYSLADPVNPQLVSEVKIPERIQGITFEYDAVSQDKYMWLSQGYQTEDSHLLKYRFDDKEKSYSRPMESYVMPEGIEQIQMTARGMYILFESAARPYRATTRVVNDQVFVIR